MLIPLQYIAGKFRMQVTGIIHVGGHFGEEEHDYRRIFPFAPRHYFEPDVASFQQLVVNTPGATHHQVALGAADSTADMYCETFNTGQSNSLLKPGTHLKHYPLIKFDSVRTVEVRTLDSFHITDCNFINLDVQGYELEVLKGATETLKHIDYLYTEVNTEDVYEGCGKLPEMDAYLTDFIRVETAMTGQGWGDSLYIAKRLIEL